MSTAVQPVQLSDILTTLRRHASILLATALLGLVAGLIAAALIPARYSATASVAVNPMSAAPLNTSADSARTVNMATEQQLVSSRAVAEGAARLLRPEHDLSPTTIRDAVSVESPPDSLILDITFSGANAAEAADGADAVANAYLENRQDNAGGQVDRLEKAATRELQALEKRYDDASGDSVRRSLGIRIDALGTRLAELASLDLNPGQIADSAEPPAGPATPGFLPLGAAGLILGAIVGVPIALTRKDVDTQIGDADALSDIEGDQLVLDGTKDADRSETWDIAALMLKIPQVRPSDDPFTIMLDAEWSPGSPEPGRELVEALSRRGCPARFVDAGVINESKICRGWPTEKRRSTWAGEVIVLDTTGLSSDAPKVALATRCDLVVLARTTADDSVALHRLAGLIRSEGVEISLVALLPARPEFMSLTH